MANELNFRPLPRGCAEAEGQGGGEAHPSYQQSVRPSFAVRAIRRDPIRISIPPRHQQTETAVSLCRATWERRGRTHHFSFTSLRFSAKVGSCIFKDRAPDRTPRKLGARIRKTPRRNPRRIGDGIYKSRRESVGFSEIKTDGLGGNEMVR